VKRRCAGLPSISEELFLSKLALLNEKKKELEKEKVSQKCMICGYAVVSFDPSISFFRPEIIFLD